MSVVIFNLFYHTMRSFYRSLSYTARDTLLSIIEIIEVVYSRDRLLLTWYEIKSHFFRWDFILLGALIHIKLIRFCLIILWKFLILWGISISVYWMSESLSMWKLISGSIFIILAVLLTDIQWYICKLLHIL